jgi:hypothetical protein
MMKKQVPLTLRQQLHALAQFLPVFEADGFEFGHWVYPPPETANVLVMGHYSLSSPADAFVQIAYKAGWVLPHFDRGEWCVTDEAAELRDNRKVLAAATPEQLAKLLTVIIRQERFCEGVVESAYEAGLLTAVIRRAAQLERERGSDA